MSLAIPQPQSPLLPLANWLPSDSPQITFLKEILPIDVLQKAICIDLDDLHQSLLTIPTSLHNEHIIALVSSASKYDETNSGMTGIRTKRKVITNLPGIFQGYQNEAGEERFIFKYTMPLTREHDMIMGVKGKILFQNPISSGQCHVDFQVGEKNLPNNSKNSPVTIKTERKDNGFSFDVECHIPVLTLAGYSNNIILEISDICEADVSFTQVMIKDEIDVVTLDVDGRNLFVSDDPIIWKCKNQLAVFWKGSYLNTDLYQLSEKDCQVLTDLQAQLLPMTL